MRLHEKVPGWLLDLNALLTEKLPRFVSLLNEMTGGRENMCLVSGSFAENFEVFENDIFYCKVLRMVGKGDKFLVRGSRLEKKMFSMKPSKKLA